MVFEVRRISGYQLHNERHLVVPSINYFNLCEERNPRLVFLILLTGENKGQITIPFTILCFCIYFSPQSKRTNALFCIILALIAFFPPFNMLVPPSWCCYLQVGLYVRTVKRCKEDNRLEGYQQDISS